MRTTLTLDSDVASLLREQARKQRRPFKDVVNEAIRRGLAPRPGAGKTGRFRVRPHRTTLRPGIDAGQMNRLVDELEDEALTATLGRRR